MKGRFSRFLLAGAAATATTYLTLIVGVELLRLPAVPASAAGYALGILVNYAINYRFTFESSKKHSAVFPKFLFVMLVGMVANATMMAVGISVIGLHYLVAQLVAIAVVLSWSYTANRLWTFAG